MADRTVTVIQPRLHLPSLSQESGKQRVAAYARVSTDSDEQMGSVEAQKDYFEKLILKVRIGNLQASMRTKESPVLP